jgi:serine protease Do
MNPLLPKSKFVRLFAYTLMSSAFLASPLMAIGLDAGTNLLEQTSKAFTQIAKKATPATVFIKAQVQSDEAALNPFNSFQDDIFGRFFGGQNFQFQQPQIQTHTGSGFIVRSDGYVVTNFHVVKDATQISVLLNDGREFQASVKGTDQRTDLAVLKIEEKALPYLGFGDSDELQVGEWVVAIGNPFGLEASLTVGVVSAKGRQDLGIASFEDFIQTDAAINPGNSGGALFNLQGEVVGVNTAIMTQSGGNMGIGLSIPSKMAKNVIDQIIDGGLVKRGYLGIVLQPLDKDLAEALNLGKQEGILISEVMAGSPAQKAGLQQGDIIIGYNDKPVKNVATFRNEIALMNPNGQVTLKLLRDNKSMLISVMLGTQGDAEEVALEVMGKLGLELENVTGELAGKLGIAHETEGVVISKVKPGSIAAQVGLRPGCVITGVAVKWNNQKRVRNMAEFDEAMKELGDKKHVILIVKQKNFQKYYTLKLN